MEPKTTFINKFEFTSKYSKYFQSGNIFFFQGSFLSSKVIQVVTGIPWSHVGFGIWKDGVYYILESTIQDKDIHVDDYISKIPKDGVQMVTFYDKVKKHSKMIGVRQLLDSTGTPVNMDKTRTKIVYDFYKLTYKIMFESNLYEFANSHFNFLGTKNKANNEQYFCSEYIAEILQLLNFLPDKYPPNDFTPKKLLEFDMKKGNPYLYTGLKVIKKEDPFSTTRNK